jgi:hypothetical protein
MNEDKDERRLRPERVKKADEAPDYAADVGWEAFLRSTRKRWPRLTDTDLSALDQIAFAVGNYEGLVGRLRERYALNESDAQKEVDVFLRGFLSRPSSTRQHGVS